MKNDVEHWHPETWKEKEARQQPVYPSPERLDQAVAELSGFPPLVTSWEVEALKAQLASAARGERFVLQGGDCAESFDDCTPPVIVDKLKIILQMSLALVHGLGRRVVRIGRIAGQYAKPRTKDTETRDGVTLASYRGDIINGIDFTAEARTPNPARMLTGYERAAMTLNYIRALVAGGFADLHHPENWDLGFMDLAPMASEYRKAVLSIGRSLDFMENILGTAPDELRRVDFYTSHEGLLLPYEQALTRRPLVKTAATRDGWYCLSTHLPWIGARTAEIDGAHVEFFRGIRNPIGIKVGPDMSPAWLKELIRVLHPDDEPGRLTLIHRFGADRIEEALPPLIEAVRETGKTVLWITDPMHGNTTSTSQGYKTRSFDRILAELRAAVSIHNEMGSRLGGVHFELTGENVTECIGGARGISEADLSRAYRTQVDPRLNYEQSMEMAMLIVQTAGRADR